MLRVRHDDLCLKSRRCLSDLLKYCLIKSEKRGFCQVRMREDLSRGEEENAETQTLIMYIDVKQQKTRNGNEEAINPLRPS